MKDEELEYIFQKLPTKKETNKKQTTKEYMEILSFKERKYKYQKKLDNFKERKKERKEKKKERKKEFD